MLGIFQLLTIVGYCLLTASEDDDELNGSS